MNYHHKKKRIEETISLLLQGFNIHEIASDLNTTPNVLYDDLIRKLPILIEDQELKDKVEEILRNDPDYRKLTEEE